MADCDNCLGQNLGMVGGKPASLSGWVDLGTGTMPGLGTGTPSAAPTAVVIGAVTIPCEYPRSGSCWGPVVAYANFSLASCGVTQRAQAPANAPATSANDWELAYSWRYTPPGGPAGSWNVLHNLRWADMVASYPSSHVEAYLGIISPGQSFTIEALVTWHTHTFTAAPGNLLSQNPLNIWVSGHSVMPS